MDKIKIINRLKIAKNQLIDGAVYSGIVSLDDLYKTELDTPKKDVFLAKKEMFNFMIEYFAKDTPDSQRENVYSQIQRDLILHTNSLIEYYKAYQLSDYKNIYSRYHQKIDYLRLLKNFDTDILRIEDVFMRIWLTNESSLNFQDILKHFFDNSNINNSIKSTITSAISLSLFRYFDYKKLLVLFDIYQKQFGECSIRALVGIIITLLIHEDVLKLYPEITNKLKELELIDDNSKNIEFIFLQFIRAKDTENIIKEFNSDILPQMKKMQDNLIKDFKDINFEDFSSEKMMDDENPGWENYFDKNPEFFEKMEQFTKQQFNGSDIFSATLGNLKNFSFFKKASNWFTPFSAENEEIITEIKGKVNDEVLDKFLTTFEKASYFCNSDKYSFCLHIPDIAPQMRDAAMNMLIAEIEGTQEMMSEDNSFSTFDETKSIIIRYVQDIYRFYNFNNNFIGFDNIFKQNIGLHRSDIFKNIENYSNIVRSCAEVSFSQKFFNDAILLFEKAIESGQNEADIYEKTAFSYQKTKNYTKALENYKKAELFDQNKKWLFKKIGFALTKLNNYSEAIQYYQKAENEDKDDLATLMFIGRCNLALEKYDEAKKNYFKVDFFDPDNPKVLRSIALCSMELGDYEQSEKYLLKTIELAPTSFDFINLGNLFWIKDDKKEAIQYYITASNENKKFSNFKKDFYDNSEILKEHKILDFDIKLMLDYLEMRFNL